MKIEKSKLEDCFEITPKVFLDHRGYFFESYNQIKFNEILEYEVSFIQDNESKSNRGVLRGLHFQRPPYAQSKLVRVMQGEVLDVAVDIRKNSITYGQHHSVILSAENKKQFFVPKGFAHGFVVLSETAIFSYKIDNVYMPTHENGIIWNDKDLKIDWHLNQKEVLLSEKDKSLQYFKDFDSPF